MSQLFQSGEGAWVLSYSCSRMPKSEVWERVRVAGPPVGKCSTSLPKVEGP